MTGTGVRGGQICEWCAHNSTFIRSSRGGKTKKFSLMNYNGGKKVWSSSLYWLCDDTSGWMDRRKKRAGPWWLFTIVDISTAGAPTGPAPISIAVNPHSSRIRESVLSAWWKRSVISIGRSRISRWWAKKFFMWWTLARFRGCADPKDSSRNFILFYNKRNSNIQSKFFRFSLEENVRRIS